MEQKKQNPKCDHSYDKGIYKFSLGKQTTARFRPKTWRPQFFVTYHCPVCGVESEPQPVYIDLIELRLAKARSRHNLEQIFKAIDEGIEIPGRSD
jgi:hypothetical protein